MGAKVNDFRKKLNCNLYQLKATMRLYANLMDHVLKWFLKLTTSSMEDPLTCYNGVQINDYTEYTSIYRIYGRKCLYEIINGAVEQ